MQVVLRVINLKHNYGFCWSWPKALKYKKIVFSARLNPKTFWKRWGTPQGQIVTVSRIVNSSTFITLSAPPTSCERDDINCASFKTVVLKLLQAVWLAQSQPEPALHPGEGTGAKVVVEQGGKRTTLTDAPDTHDAHHWNNFQANKTYMEKTNSIPSYISSLPSPLRKRHKDDLLVTDTTVRLIDDHERVSSYF